MDGRSNGDTSLHGPVRGLALCSNDMPCSLPLLPTSSPSEPPSSCPFQSPPVISPAEVFLASHLQAPPLPSGLLPKLPWIAHPVFYFSPSLLSFVSLPGFSRLFPGLLCSAPLAFRGWHCGRRPKAVAAAKPQELCAGVDSLFRLDFLDILESFPFCCVLPSWHKLDLLQVLCY